LRTRSSKTSLRNLHFSSEKWFSDWLKLPLTALSKDMIFKRHKKIGEEVGNTTANIGLRLLRTVYNFAMLTNDTLPPNPVRTLSLSKSWFKDVRRQTLIKPTQLKSWHEAVMLIENSGIRDYFCLLLFTGMRKQEGLTLKWNNVDFNEKVITVPETKSGRPLVIPMSDYICELLKARKKRTEDSIWVFPSIGKTGHLVEPKKSVAWVGKKSGVTFMLHDLRRTFITIAESLDISAYAVKQLVNHSSGGDVTAGYIIMNVERLREPMQKIAAYILDKIHSNDKNETDSEGKPSIDTKRKI
jgi:integrase